MPGDKDLKLGIGDPFYIYDMKYIEKEKFLYITFFIKDKNVPMIERNLSIKIYAELTNIL